LLHAAKIGSETGMTETRKLAAILVARVVGYSWLAGADEERTLARLRARSPALHARAPEQTA
jgi:class 3 adenylate cyclase